MAHQGFGAIAVVDAVKAHHEQLLAGQLAAAFERDRLDRSALALQPAGAWPGEALGKVAQRQHPQLPLQPLGGHHPAHLEKCVGGTFVSCGHSP